MDRPKRVTSPTWGPHLHVNRPDSKRTLGYRDLKFRVKTKRDTRIFEKNNLGIYQTRQITISIWVI